MSDRQALAHLAQFEAQLDKVEVELHALEVLMDGEEKACSDFLNEISHAIEEHASHHQEAITAANQCKAHFLACVEKVEAVIKEWDQEGRNDSAALVRVAEHTLTANQGMVQMLDSTGHDIERDIAWVKDHKAAAAIVAVDAICLSPVVIFFGTFLGIGAALGEGIVIATDKFKQLYHEHSQHILDAHSATIGQVTAYGQKFPQHAQSVADDLHHKTKRVQDEVKASLATFAGHVDGHLDRLSEHSQQLQQGMATAADHVAGITDGTVNELAGLSAHMHQTSADLQALSEAVERVKSGLETLSL